MLPVGRPAGLLRSCTQCPEGRAGPRRGRLLCRRGRLGCFLDEDQWIFLEDLRQQVPLEIYNTERFLKKNKTVEVQRGNQVIFLRIRDFKLKDSVSPFSLQKAKIRSMILNRRKSELLSTLRADVYRQALKENQIEMHYERP